VDECAGLYPVCIKMLEFAYTFKDIDATHIQIRSGT
jgi:hypothetical protein